MNQPHDDTLGAVMLKSTLYVIAWIGSWKVGEIQAAVGILSGLIVAGFAATQWWVLWRDKIRRKPKHSARPSGHMPLEEP